MVDLSVENHGSILLLRPLSSAGTAWIDGHIDGEAQSFGGAIVVEPRYISDIVAGAIDDGLEVE